jgi:hypothetical protein
LVNIMAELVAVLQCPTCPDELDAETRPVHDWKRGSVRISLVPTPSAVAHLIEHEHQTTDEGEGAEGSETPNGDDAPADQAPADDVATSSDPGVATDIAEELQTTPAEESPVTSKSKQRGAGSK